MSVGTLRRPLRPRDPEHPIGVDRGGELLDARLELAPRGDEEDDDVGVPRVLRPAARRPEAVEKTVGVARIGHDRERAALVDPELPRAAACPNSPRSEHDRAVVGEVQQGLCATSHGWPSGSTNTPEYPPQNVSAGSRAMRAPAARASSITASTSAGERTLCASVMPPQPPRPSTPLSSARSERPQRPTTMPPAWKKTTPSVPGLCDQPRAS